MKTETLSKNPDLKELDKLRLIFKLRIPPAIEHEMRWTGFDVYRVSDLTIVRTVHGEHFFDKKGKFLPK